MALVTIKVDNTPASGRAALLAAWAQIPASSTGNSYDVVFDKGAGNVAYQMGTDVLTLPTKIVDSANKITIRCEVGHSFRDNPNVQTNRYAYVPANGVALTFSNSDKNCLVVDSDYFEIEGIQIANTFGPFGGGTTLVVSKPTSLIKNCIVESANHSASSIGVECMGDILNTLVISRAAYSIGFKYNADSLLENCLAVRVSDRANGGGFAFTTPYNTGILHNCASFNFDKFSEYTNVQFGSNNATDKAIMPFGANSLANLVYADQFVSTTGDLDFRTKTGSALIDAGSTPSSGNTGAGPSGTRQQGTSVDIGSWEFPNALQSPSATVTAINVTGRSVTVSGVTTGVPTSGTITVTPSAVAYNSAEAAGPVAITFGTGTFTVTINTLKVGKYSLQFQVANAAYTVNGENPIGTFDVTGALATSVNQDSMGGQILRVYGNVSGAPTSGSILVPASTTNPNGASDKVQSVTITGSTYDVSVTLTPGNYAASILRFTTAAGTSLPQAGTEAVSIAGMSGNPEAPADEAPPTPVVSSVTISPKTATGSIKFSAFALGTNSPPQTFEYSVTGGTIDNEGNYTAPAATNQVQNFTVTATSTFDPTKFDTATVTIQPAAIILAVEIDLTTNGTTPAGNLSNLKWAWFDQATPNLFTAPTNSGTSESTDGSGVLRINLPNTTLSSGDVGWLIVTDSDGNASSAHKAFSGPVTVI